MKIFSNLGATKPEFLLVGLGNVGKEYENTRHNAGFMAIDFYAKESSASIDRLKFKALTTTLTISGKSVLLHKNQ